MTTKAPIKWAQRKGEVFLKVDVPDLEQVTMNLDEATNTLVFKGKSREASYENELVFYGDIQKEGSVNVVHGKATEMIIKKKESGPHWPRLTKDKVKLNWLAVDWGKYVDEDDEGSKKDFDMSGFDPSSFGDFMGGGAPEFGDDDEMPPLDAEESL